jgi:T-complex protein 1 subunit alpha
VVFKALQVMVSMIYSILTITGSASAVLLVSALMNEANSMIGDGIHPNVIATEYNRICKFAIEQIKTKYAVNVLKTSKESTNLSTTVEIDQQYLIDLAKTTLQTRIDRTISTEFAQICVQATQRLYAELTIEHMRNEHFERQQRANVKIQVVGQSDLETSISLVEGLVIEQGVRDPNMPTKLHSCKILFIDEPLELIDVKSSLQSSSAHMEFHTAKERVALIRGEREVIDRKVKIIIESGANVVLSSEAIDAISLSQFAKSGIIALRHVRKETFQAAIEATQARCVRSITAQLSSQFFGYAENVHIVENEENVL